MAYASNVDEAAARSALAAVVPRLAELVRTIPDPAAPALGEWNAADVAVHLAHVWERLPALARGEMDSPLSTIEDLGAFTTELVRQEQDRDLAAIAGRIEAGAAAYLATPLAGDTARPWLFQGTALPPSAFACHMLNESLVHGYDIARAGGRPWHIDSAHAGMALMGFLFPALSVVDPRAPVVQERAAGLRARFDIRVRGSGAIHLGLDDGMATLESPNGHPVDCHISAEPAALFLLIWSRTSQWPALLRGRIFSWGRKPWLAARLPSLLRNP